MVLILMMCVERLRLACAETHDSRPASFESLQAVAEQAELGETPREH